MIIVGILGCDCRNHLFSDFPLAMVAGLRQRRTPIESYQIEPIVVDCCNHIDVLFAYDLCKYATSK